MNKNNFRFINQKDFDSFFKLMDDSFPSEEIRSYEGQANLFYDDSYKIIADKDAEGNVTAFMATWEFDDFNFIEHFAVDGKLRGKGIGTVMLKDYLKQSNKPIFLEVEYPKTEIATRRIEFYKRLGFHVNPFDYMQPPLHKGYSFLPLKVMSYPNKVNERQFSNYKEGVYSKVYSL
ncbi:GNAT family N-acetyltransferase [Clostridium uliginosum]|uniref:Acetyltransferase (GNAT) domain-containing protein n=1 Tax=Clostridium uliginosum TaxID=119641 RepID=A0A1I1MZ58_9CLOT|nr:GNAT family N-acetyltransferase [Clostridium uliginosum]SFC90376.1 Acetyltransferase (GNAT) domain-containing protein [Clostridium uliginosum]